MFSGKFSCIRHPEYVFQIKLYCLLFILVTVLLKNNVDRNILIFLPLHKNSCLWFAIWVWNVNNSLDSHQHFTLIIEQHHIFKSPINYKMKNFPSPHIFCFMDLFLNQLVQQVIGVLITLAKWCRKQKDINHKCYLAVSTGENHIQLTLHILLFE